ncbi:glycosyltransferase [Priestia aryabhattai]|uniref:glycosyltransferase n=1 Tax=Priestia aryabhattai TaxID=412384 RepID=UPI001C8EBC5F|nr:glycosyltransferase [Priestia aryabhattai]MBX9987786.1 glycosyltransferase [Priestia aryabhattai]
MGKISIIVPIYNVQAYLERCIESLINQTYKNIEIILVNDGSTDNCKNICELYKQRDDRIVVVHKENGGLSSARNAGIEIATGKYIAFVDSDDWVSIHMYKILTNLIEKYQADVAECEYLRTDSLLNSVNNDTSNNNVISVKNNVEALFLHFGNSKFQQVVWNKIYKRTLFKEIRFPVGKIHEDEFITYKIIYNAKKLVSISEQLYYYFERTNSIMGEGFSLKTLDRLEAFEEKERFFRSKNSELASLARDQYLNDSINSYYLMGKSKNIDNKDTHEYNLKKIIIAKINSGKLHKRNVKVKFILFKLNPSIYNFAKKLKTIF